jgi:uncharacterized protein (DUF1778 family)
VYLLDTQYTNHHLLSLSGNIDMAQSATRTAPINLRALESQRSLIDRAASVSGKNRSDFMLEAACREAENILLDQRLLMLNDSDFNTFLSMLDAPVKDSPELNKLMAHKAAWE